MGYLVGISSLKPIKNWLTIHPSYKFFRNNSVIFSELWMLFNHIAFTISGSKFSQVKVGVFKLQFLSKHGNLFPKLFWPTWRKIGTVIEIFFWNCRLKAKDLQNFRDYQNNSFKKWVRTIFETECYSNLLMEIYHT